MITVALDNDIFSNGQAYTAISRGRRLKNVNIVSLNWSAFRADFEAIQEYKRLEQLSVKLPELAI